MTEEERYQAWKKNRLAMTEFEASMRKMIKASWRCDLCIAKSQQRACCICGPTRRNG